MTMKRLLLLIVALCITLGAMAQGQNIIPKPRSYVNGDSGYTIKYSCKISCDDELLPAASYLAGKLGIGVAKEGDIYLGLDSRLAEEAYQLSVYNKGIIIIGGGYGGVFNGITTLLQLLPDAVYASNLVLPCSIPGCAIEDAPRYEHRGFMLDVCRTWMPKEDVCAYIDLLAYHKINSLRLHLTDDEAWRIEIKSHPELAMIGGWRGGDSPIHSRYGKWNEKWGGYYTQQDIRDIIAYAAQRNIEVVPEIDLPGHSLCLATIHPEVLCDYKPNTSVSLGQDVRSAICPSNEANFKLIEDILGEVALLFPSKYIHVGGDEVDLSQWQSCERCVAFMNRTGMHKADELRTYFMLRVAEILARNGKLMAVWNDAIDGNRHNGHHAKEAAQQHQGERRIGAEKMQGGMGCFPLFRRRQSRFGKGRKHRQDHDQRHDQDTVGQHGSLNTETSRLLPLQHTNHSIGESAKSPTQTILDIHTGIDELHGHGVDQGTGVDLQHTQQKKDQRRSPPAGAGKIKQEIDDQCGNHQSHKQPFDRHLGMLVCPVADERHGNHTGEAGKRQKNSHITAGKSTIQQDGSLERRKRPQHAPVSNLQQTIHSIYIFFRRHELPPFCLLMPKSLRHRLIIRHFSLLFKSTKYGILYPLTEYAPVMELVDMRDLGSRAFSVWVRVPSGAPKQQCPFAATAVLLFPKP